MNATPEAVMTAANLLQEREKLLAARECVKPGMQGNFALTLQSLDPALLPRSEAEPICEVLDRQIARVEEQLRLRGVDLGEGSA